MLSDISSQSFNNVVNNFKETVIGSCEMRLCHAIRYNFPSQNYCQLKSSELPHFLQFQHCYREFQRSYNALYIDAPIIYGFSKKFQLMHKFLSIPISTILAVKVNLQHKLKSENLQQEWRSIPEMGSQSLGSICSNEVQIQLRLILNKTNKTR